MLIISVQSPAWANCQKTLDACDRAVETCKVALDARNEEVKLCNFALRQAVDQNFALKDEIESKDKQLRAWYRNPYFMVALGLVIGVAVTK